MHVKLCAHAQQTPSYSKRGLNIHSKLGLTRGDTEIAPVSAGREGVLRQRVLRRGRVNFRRLGGLVISLALALAFLALAFRFRSFVPPAAVSCGSVLRDSLKRKCPRSS